MVRQIAYLRRAWQIQNETWTRRVFRWTRVAPSTNVARGRIVILCGGHRSKEELDQILKDGLSEGGISNRSPPFPPCPCKPCQSRRNL